MKGLSITIASCASILAIALAVPAHAQDATAPSADQEATGTNDIIVTAQRRSESVVEVPISITVADQRQLERQQVNTITDLNRIAPSLEILASPGQNTGGGGQIRGVGTQTFAAGAAASVGIIVDQVSQGNANIGDLFDIARVEVLKGPQGTLFGLTTSAGAINITTNAPDPTVVSARVRTQISNEGTAGSKFGNQIFQGVFNLPLSGNAAIRLSGVANLRQGITYNRATGKHVDIDRFVVRGRLLWEPIDAFTVNLIGDLNMSRTSFGGDFFTYIRAPADIAARLATCGIVAREGNQDVCTALNPRDQARNYGGSLQLDYDLGPVTLTSITAGRRTETDPTGLGTIIRVDALSTQLFSGPGQGGRGSLFTQELRVSSPSNSTFEYTAGGFLSRETSRGTPSAFRIVVNPAPGVFIPVVNDPGRTSKVTNESWAVFGQGTYHLSDQFSVLGGIRYTETDLRLDQTPVGGVFQTQGQSAEEISYKAGAQYQITPRSLAYATVSRGFKGGQIAIPTGAAPVVLRPEIPMSYEVGFKSNLVGGWVLDLNAFYQKFDNFQAQQCLVNATSGQLLCTQTNLPNIKSRGAEISAFGNISRDLSLSTGFIWAKTTYPDNFLGDDGSNIGGEQLAYAPEYKFTFSGEYSRELSTSIKGFLAADAVWKSRIRYTANSNRDTQYPAHWIVGGRVGVRSADDRFSLNVFARNLLNEHEPAQFLASGPELLALYGPQSFREVGLSFDARF